MLTRFYETLFTVSAIHILEGEASRLGHQGTSTRKLASVKCEGADASPSVFNDSGQKKTPIP